MTSATPLTMLTALLLGMVANGAGSVCNVVACGAVADGKTLDTLSIQKAISDPACSVVFLPHANSSVYLTGTLMLRSHLTVRIEAGAILRGANASVYMIPEDNPFDQYQDFGHSHWHNSLMWGDGLVNVTISGGGTLDGGGGLWSSEPPDGYGDKLLAFKSSSNIVLQDIIGLRTGHFGLLATNVTGLVMRNVNFTPTRDGIDLVSCSDFFGSNLTILGGGDDAFVIKSDYSLGSILHSRNLTLVDSAVGTRGATALEIGSETIGDFEGVHFRNILVTSAGDSAIGMAIMDGANVRDVSYHNISTYGAASPIMFYIGARQTGHPAGTGNKVGSIRDVVVSGIQAFNMSDPYHPGPPRNWTAMIDGMPASNLSSESSVGPNITIEDTVLHFNGGGTAGGGRSLEPTHPATTWFKTGPWPAYGFFIRRARDIKLKNVSLSFDCEDNRPAIVMESVQDITLDAVTADRGRNAIFDVILKGNCSHLQLSGGNLTITTESLQTST